MLNPNQFQQSAIQGQLDLRMNSSSVSCQIDDSSAGGLVPGQAVKLVQDYNGIPRVVECAADEDDVFGFLNYDFKSQTFEKGDYAEISVFRGNVMFMTASEAINRGAKVMIVPASKKVSNATSTNRIVGIAFDKASGDESLIRVYIDLPGALAS